MGRGKIHLVAAVVILSVIFYQHTSLALDMDALYEPLLQKGGFFYQGQLDFFRMETRGVTGTNFGSVVYDEFDMSPYYFQLENALRAAPWEAGEVEFGYTQGFPNKFRLLTYSTQGSLAAVQEYDLDYTQDFALSVRGRQGGWEWYVKALEKRQKSAWSGFTYPVAAPSYNSIKAHYEDMSAGLRYLSAQPDEPESSNLERIKRGLLQKEQVNLEAELRYRSGTVRRDNDLYYFGTYFLNFYHELNYHLTPGVLGRYGLCDDTELEAGVFFTTPFSYKYKYREYRPTPGQYLFVTGDYQWDRNFEVPLALRQRIRSNLQLEARADQRFVTQQLDYERNTSGTREVFDDRQLSYHRIRPSLTLTYLYEAGKEITQDEFGSLTKCLLRQGQALIELSWQRDITHINRSLADDSLNLIDPYDLFFYPLDYFVAGSEYASFFSGNNSRFAADLPQQNYDLLQASLTYGLSDSLNAGIRLGYHSGSWAQHFTLYDLKDRFYKFRPYYFIDSMLDWRMNDTTLISLSLHYVPRYTTFLDRADDARAHKSEARYFAVSAGVKILF